MKLIGINELKNRTELIIMAKSKKKALEDFFEILKKDEIIAEIEKLSVLKSHLNENPFWISSMTISDKEAETTLLCPKCGEVFVSEESFSKNYLGKFYLPSGVNESCPYCGHESCEGLALPAEDETKITLSIDSRGKYVAYSSGTEIYFYHLSFYLYLDKIEDEWVPTYNFQPTAFACIDTETGVVTKFKAKNMFSTPPEFVSTTAKIKSILSSVYWASEKGSSYKDLIVNITDMTLDDFKTLIRAYDEEKLKGKSRKEEKIPETSVDYPTISHSEYFGIIDEEISYEALSGIETRRAKCLCCGHSWLYTNKRYDIPLLVCPECGTEQTEHCSYYSHKNHLYLTADEEGIEAKLVSYTCGYFKKIDTPPPISSKLETIYRITPKGKVTTYTRNYDGYLYPSPRLIKGHTGAVNEITIISDFENKIQYTGIEEFFKHVPHCSAYNYILHISNACKNSVYEKIAKANLARELNLILSDKNTAGEINPKATTIHDAFYLSNSLLKAYRTHHSDEPRYIITYQQYYKAFPEIQPEHIAWAIRENVEYQYIQNIVNLCDIKASDAIAYLERVRLTQMFHPIGAAVEWRDYLEAAASIGMDMKDRHVLYPRALKTEHDIVISKARFIADDDTKEKFNAAVEEYKRLEYHKDDYFIRVPASTEEMLEEGRKLHHCCGRYVDDVARKTAFVLFLRKKSDPDTPFLSMEVLPTGEIRQVRGLNDSYVHVLPDYREINAFLKSFAKMKHLELDLR